MMLYGILIFGAVMALGGIYWTGDSAGHAAQKAKDDPLIAAASAQRDQAIAANQGLQRDFEGINAKVAACNAKVAELSGPGVAALAAISAAKAASDQRARALEGRLAQMQRDAAVPSNKSATLQCESAKEVLGEVSDRIRAMLGFDKSTPPPTPTDAVIITPAPAAKLPPSASRPLPSAVRTVPK